jgi:DHA2 family multidrug resistance protein
MANQTMEGRIVRQTMLLTYDNLYLIIGVFTLFCVPIIFLQKFKKKPMVLAGGH